MNKTDRIPVISLFSQCRVTPRVSVSLLGFLLEMSGEQIQELAAVTESAVED